MSNMPVKPLSPACASARDSGLNASDTGLSIAERLHLTTCASCSPLWRQMRRLVDRSRRLPLDPAPDSLRSRVLEQVQTRSIPAPFAPDVAEGARKPLPYRPLVAGVAGVAAITGIAGVCISNWSAWFPSTEAQVRTAIGSAQTWHFVGWCLQNGQRVPWEVWGRRRPYLYREQIGDMVFVDNGDIRTQVLPPTPTRLQGLVVISKTNQVPPLNGLSIHNSDFLTGSSYGWDRFHLTDRDSNNLLIRGSFAYVEDVPPSKQVNPMAPVYPAFGIGQSTEKQRVEDNLLIEADAQTKLPARYSLTSVRYAPRPVSAPVGASPGRPPVVGQGRKNKGAPVSSENTAELTLSYNISIPPEIEIVTAPSTYNRANVVRQTAFPQKPTDSMTVLGITVKGNVTAWDAAGNLRIQLLPLLEGQSRTTARIPSGIGVSILRQLSDTGISNQSQQWGAVDDQGRRYVDIGRPEYSQRRTPYPEMYFAPLEPLAPGAPRPHHLRLLVQVNRQLGEWVRENRMTSMARSVSGSGALMLDLPAMVTSLQFDTPAPQVEVRPRYTIQYSRNGVNGVATSSLRRTLAYKTAKARAQEYQSLSSLYQTQNSTAQHKETLRVVTLKKAADYLEQAASIALKQAKGDTKDYFFKQDLEEAQRLRKTLRQ